MNVNITARHCDVSEALRSRVHARTERLVRFNQRVSGLEVIFDGDGSSSRVEARVRVDGEEPILAQATGQSFREAFDRVMDKVVRQARRRRERRRDHQAAKLTQP